MATKMWNSGFPEWLKQRFSGLQQDAHSCSFSVCLKKLNLSHFCIALHAMQKLFCRPGERASFRPQGRMIWSERTLNSGYMNPPGYSQSLQECDDMGEGRICLKRRGATAQTGMSWSGCLSALAFAIISRGSVGDGFFVFPDFIFVEIRAGAGFHLAASAYADCDNFPAGAPR